MGKVVLDFGTEVDMLNKTELQEALAEDARLRALVTGVKSGDLWINSGNPGMGTTSFSTSGTPPQGPAAGFIWAIMNAGFELSATSSVRVYKGIPQSLGSAPAGNGRLVAITGGGNATVFASWSKGQLMMRSGDQLSFQPSTAANILSIFLTYIEIPAERVGELLL